MLEPGLFLLSSQDFLPRSTLKTSHPCPPWPHKWASTPTPACSWQARGAQGPWAQPTFRKHPDQCQARALRPTQQGARCGPPQPGWVMSPSSWAAGWGPRCQRGQSSPAPHFSSWGSGTAWAPCSFQEHAPQPQTCQKPWQRSEQSPGHRIPLFPGGFHVTCMPRPEGSPRDDRFSCAQVGISSCKSASEDGPECLGQTQALERTPPWLTARAVGSNPAGLTQATHSILCASPCPQPEPALLEDP